MKFLSKKKNSAILSENLEYKRGRDNSRLRELLLTEQFGFCAYTEKRVHSLDSVDVEHFDASQKGRDDYFNYYATLHEANLRKIRKDSVYKGASFFTSMFFQSDSELNARIHYVTEDGIYEEIDPTDTEAASFIDFLGFNDNVVVEERRRHLSLLKDILDAADFEKEDIFDWFMTHPEHLSFITAIEAELNIDLSTIISDL